jgi:hypothetical protein
MKRYGIPLTLALGLAACTSQQHDSAAATAKTTVAAAQAGELTVTLLTDTRLETGMTPVYVKVETAGGQPVPNATVTFTPMMAMSTGMSHSAPVIGPPALDDQGLYRCDVVFQMATSAMGSWSATVSIARPGVATATAEFPSLTVADSGRGKAFIYTDPVASSTTKYVASLNFDAAPKVGLNDVKVTLHRMQDAMTFVAVNDATIVLDPEMPSMGHGSPGSVNPTLASPGVYGGQLSFSMPGDWETTVTLSSGGVTLGAPKFSTNF